MKTASFLASILMLSATAAPAGTILWVSDLIPIGATASDNDGGAVGVFGGGPGPYADEGFVSLLSGAGHTVTRFNPAAGAATLSAADVAALNSYDLVILGRSILSSVMDSAAKTLPWNSQVTKPILAINSYLTRGNRLGWFPGTTQPDSVLNSLTFSDLNDPIQAYLTSGISLSGMTTVNSVTEAVIYPDGAVDPRGTSLINGPTVAGGTVLATTNNGMSSFIASIPAGTAITAGLSAGQTLGGFRMQFLAGNRESTTAPNNPIGSAGFENLTPEGELLFLRSVDIAINNGNVPIPEPATVTLAAIAALPLLRRRR